ncbi:MAG: hypothetical protein GC200_11530 [Tepidisphaera sp.]|nr:hypothetical protein [Tepidisphaera sp.]
MLPRRYLPQHELPQQPCPQQEPLQDEHPSSQHAAPQEEQVALQQLWHGAAQAEGAFAAVGAREETPGIIAARTAALSIIEIMMNSPNLVN